MTPLEKAATAAPPPEFLKVESDTRTCESCRFWKRAADTDISLIGEKKNAADAGVCHLSPPVAQLMTGQSKIGVIQQALMGFFPPCGANNFCSHHTRAGELTSEEGAAYALTRIGVALEHLARVAEVTSNKPG